MQITIKDVDISTEIDVNIHLDDVIKAINELEIKSRYNYIAKIIIGVSNEDISDLDKEQKLLIRNYFKRELNKFSDT